jgi:hypothetical protein
MRGLFLSLSLLLALTAAPAARAGDCGGDAFTYAELVEARPGAAGKGPVMSIPDSLCADLVESRKTAIGSFSLQIGDPYGMPSVRGRARDARPPGR